MSRRNPAVLGKWGPDGVRVVNKDWDKPLQWDRAAAKTGERRRVFPSLCDPFEDRPDLDAPRVKLFATIDRTPNLDWLLLTKRPENVASLWAYYDDEGQPYFPPNVWLGTSVEDQQRADERTPALLKIPAAIRWLSVEPLLGPIDLTPWLESVFVADFDPDDRGYLTPAIDWVVIGGESGSNARPCDLAWIRSIVAQCKAAGVPVFVKQLGSVAWDESQWMQRMKIGDTSREYVRYCRVRLSHPKGGDPAEWPVDLRIREFPARA